MEVTMPKDLAESWIQLIMWGCGSIEGLFGMFKQRV